MKEKARQKEGWKIAQKFLKKINVLCDVKDWRYLILGKTDEDNGLLNKHRMVTSCPEALHNDAVQHVVNGLLLRVLWKFIIKQSH